MQAFEIRSGALSFIKPQLIYFNKLCVLFNLYSVPKKSSPLKSSACAACSNLNALTPQ